MNLNLAEGLYFVARLHSAADGLAKYGKWGEPQLVGIWADDVITVCVHATRSVDHFERSKYEDVAELHLPWELVCRGAPAGEEMVFDLAMARGAPWLGQNALQGQYQEAFRLSRDALIANPSSPRIRIGLREVPQGRAPMRSPLAPPTLEAPREASPAAREAPALPTFTWAHACSGPVGPSSPTQPPVQPSSMGSRRPSTSTPLQPAAAPGTPPPHGLSSVRDLDGGSTAGQEQYRLHQLRLRNHELRQQLGLLDQDGPDVDAQAGERAHFLGAAAAENNRLRAEASGLEQELAAACGELAALGDAARGPRDDEIAGEWERHCSAVMADIQAVIQENNELSMHCDGEIQTLQEELSAVLWQQLPGEQLLDESAGGQADVARLHLEAQDQELHALLTDCQDMEGYLQTAGAEALALEHEADTLRYRQLQFECERCQQDMAQVRLQLKQVPMASLGEMSMPATAVLNAEVDHLQQQLADLHQRRSREQAEMEERPGQLRRETSGLAERLRQTSELARAAEAELEELQQAHERDIRELRSSAAERARSARLHEEKELIRDALVKDVARSNRRIGVLDQKIEQLAAEAQDLAERAGTTRQAPLDAGGDAAQAARLEELAREVQEYEQSVLSAKQEEHNLTQERDAVKRELDSTELGVRVAEHRVRLLRNSTRPAPEA